MNKYLCSLIAAMFAILSTIGAWWVNRVEKSMEITTQLQFKDRYLNGNIAAVPVTAPTGTPPPANK